MEKFGRNIFTETICKDSNPQNKTGHPNKTNRNVNKNSQSTNNIINHNNKDKENNDNVNSNTEIPKSNTSDIDIKKTHSKKIKHLIYLSQNTSNFNINELQAATWYGLPFGKNTN